jgi:hypothetical protein
MGVFPLFLAREETPRNERFFCTAHWCREGVILKIVLC